MPDVSRSDSQRSDTSTSKPRVSFNRDVHVKRIVSRDTPPVSGALSGDGAGHLVALPVRKERIGSLSKKQLAEEAAKVISQADKIDCTTNQDKNPEKFYTLPARRKKRKSNSESPHSSHERLNTRRRSEELGVIITTPPKKPPRTFAHSTPIKTPKQKNSFFKLFTKTDKDVEPKKSNLRRSVSDASNLKSNSFEKPNRKRSGSESEDIPNNTSTKKTQLSPIIEVSTPKDDYFSPKKDYFSDKENASDFVQEKNGLNLTSKPPRKKWNKSNIKDYNKGFLNEKDSNVKVPDIVIIDVEKADSISDNKKKKLNSNSFKNKFKSLLSNNKKDSTKNSEKKREPETPQIIQTNEESVDEVDNIITNDFDIESELLHPPEAKTSPIIQEKIKILEESFEKPLDMIHSSQQPAERIPLTRGHKVDSMVKRLSRDKYSPPPKTNTILVTPTVTVAHNNNQPFSYTQQRGVSPERPYSRSKSPERPYSRSKSPERPYSRSKSPSFDKPSSPIIYAQVVCGNGEPEGNGFNKKTVHTIYPNNKNKFQHSDSDEGLGYEENSGFNRKYTHFGDQKKHEIDDKFDEEYPITPKFKSFGSNGFDNYEYSKSEHHTTYIDSSARGRGDGMDSRRRESLTEPQIENGILNKFNDLNGKSDLSYRRDLLESRINSRRLGDKIISNNSPELCNPRVNKYVSETTSRYYRHGSTSPVGFTENYRSETKVDRHGEKYITESRTRAVQGDRNEKNYEYNNRYDRFDGEPKSLDSQISDYRSSPENGANRKYFTSQDTKEYRVHSNKYKPKTEKLSKDRDHYKSNPEILNRNYDSTYKYDISETYHDSLRRQKNDIRRDKVKRTEKYFDDRDRKDKFGDSGIENDFRRDSGENVRVTRNYSQPYRSNNESEDEGFASSLLIASERQHTEDNFNKKFRNYDSDKEIRRNGDVKKSKHEYVHRERSIDDGSHYDPRIDKDVDDKRGSLKVEKKPPKPAKISSLKKVKQLFTRDTNKKKKDKMELVREESLRARYKEYRGSNEAVNRSTLKRDNHADYRRGYNSDSRIDNNSDNSQSYDYSNRRRLSTPSPSPTREIQQNVQSAKQNDGWFKSLDRFSLKKNKSNKADNKDLKEDSQKPTPTRQTKNLRFFGDTDLESDTSVRRKSSLKSRPNITTYKSPSVQKSRSQSTRNLHNISEEFNHSDTDTLRKYKNHKSMQNISESDRDIKGSRSNLKPPISPTRRTDTLKKNTDTRNRKRRNEISSVESSTEGDSSQQSQRSVVYLHAATVGDIPGPGYLARNGRRAASKEDLISNGSSRLHTQSKTLSRSFSVLAPWKPRYAHESIEVDYSQQNRPVRNIRNGSSKSGAKTAKEISNQKKMSNQNLSTLNRKSKSKENVSNTLNRRSTKDELSSKSSNTTLYKKKERQPKENMRYSRDDKKISSKSMSVESLGGGSRSSVKSKEDPRNISRSISMPRDPEKSAGWFNKMNKKSTSKKNLSTQRL